MGGGAVGAVRGWGWVWAFFSLHKVTKLINALQITGQKNAKKVMKAVFAEGITH